MCDVTRLVKGELREGRCHEMEDGELEARKETYTYG